MKESSRPKNVLIYCRESRDDGFINYERIETQRDILVTYCEKNQLGIIIDVIMDNNKSGTDFERLEPIKRRIRDKEVDILLLKDASRLGRNILESLTFTAFLEEYHVELIFESEKYDEDMFPLISWFNERRAKDDSNKIRRVLRHKMEAGEIVIKAPYGYIKQGNQLIIDETAAQVVREIFALFLKGHGKYEIASIINRQGYPTPSLVRKQYENTTCSYIWNKQHIDRILNHVIYTGDMPYGMRRKVSFKSKKFENVEKEDWVVVPDHHPAIISKEEFQEAQSLMKRNKKAKTRNPSQNIFSGLIFCGRCGSRMYRKTQKGKKAWYICRKNDQEGGVKDHIRPGYGCSSHRIREADLIEIVKEYIGRLISDPKFEESILLNLDRFKSTESNTMDEIWLTKNRIEDLKLKISRIYDDKLEGRLPDFLINEKIEECAKALNRLTEKLGQLEQTLAEIRQTEDDGDKRSQLIKILQDNGINHQTLSLLFNRIIVYNPEDITQEAIAQYNISEAEYTYLKKNGGILFIQSFAYKASLLEWSDI